MKMGGSSVSAQGEKKQGGQPWKIETTELQSKSYDYVKRDVTKERMGGEEESTSETAV